MKFFLMRVFLICSFSVALAQTQNKCKTELTEAEKKYGIAKFREAINLARRCLSKDNIENAEKERAYKVIIQAYIGQDSLAQARYVTEGLLEINPNFEADPEQYPPPFVNLINDVRQQREAMRQREIELERQRNREAMRQQQLERESQQEDLRQLETQSKLGIGVSGEIGLFQICAGDECTKISTFFSFGGFLKIWLSEKFEFQPEVTYKKATVQNDFVFASTGNPTGDIYEYTASYVNVQLLIMLIRGSRSSSFRPRGFAGPYIVAAPKAEYAIILANGNKVEGELSIKSDIGIVFGFGFELGRFVQKTSPFIFMDIRSQLGFKNLSGSIGGIPLSDDDIFFAGKNYGFSLVLGVGF